MTSWQGWWLVHAAPSEAALLADLRPRQLGVGKVAAAANLAQWLAREPAPRGVLLFGVAGAVPSRLRGPGWPQQLGDLCLVARDELADEGVRIPGGWLSLADAGLLQVGPYCAAAPALRAAAASVPHQVAGITVSTCSGEDALALERWQRHGAVLESMEGAAVAQVCAQFGVPWLQLRAVSNWTGDRDRGAWDLPRATLAVQQAVRQLFGC